MILTILKLHLLALALLLEKATVKVTPSDTVRGIGGENPEFELEYKGLLLDDIPADIDSPPTASTEASKIPLAETTTLH